jgi:hypothetical protein
MSSTRLPNVPNGFTVVGNEHKETDQWRSCAGSGNDLLCKSRAAEPLGLSLAWMRVGD